MTCKTEVHDRYPAHVVEQKNSLSVYCVFFSLVFFVVVVGVFWGCLLLLPLLFLLLLLLLFLGAVQFNSCHCETIQPCNTVVFSSDYTCTGRTCKRPYLKTEFSIFVHLYAIHSSGWRRGRGRCGWGEGRGGGIVLTIITL